MEIGAALMVVVLVQVGVGAGVDAAGLVPTRRSPWCAPSCPRAPSCRIECPLTEVVEVWLELSTTLVLPLSTLVEPWLPLITMLATGCHQAATGWRDCRRGCRRRRWPAAVAAAGVDVLDDGPAVAAR